MLPTSENKWRSLSPIGESITGNHDGQTIGFCSVAVMARSTPSAVHERAQARHRLRDLWSSASSGDGEEAEEAGDGPQDT